MENVRRKLHSNTGASMLLALMFLLFCATVGAVVLTAASANAGRLARNTAEQQSRLAVESVALLLREDFADLELTGRYFRDEFVEEVEEEDGSISVIVHEPVYRKDDVKLTGTPMRTLATLEQDLRDLFFSTCGHFPGNATPAQMSYELIFAAEGELPEVWGNVSVSRDKADRYAITVVLKTKEGSGSMTLRFAAKTPVESSSSIVTSRVNGTVTTTAYTWTWSWLTSTITKGEVSGP